MGLKIVSHKEYYVNLTRLLTSGPLQAETNLAFAFQARDDLFQDLDDLILAYGMFFEF
jgi:hypothetical protein